MEQTRDGFNLWGFQQRTSPMLLVWALGSTASWTLGMRNQNGALAGFGRQFAMWGAINTILTAFGFSRTTRNLARQGQGEISAEELAWQTKNFERLVLLNADLDKGYIAAVAELATQSLIQGDKPEERSVSFRNGVGLGTWLVEPFFAFGIPCSH
jgi:Family of unknown function (DUF6992)